MASSSSGAALPSHSGGRILPHNYDDAQRPLLDSLSRQQHGDGDTSDGDGDEAPSRWSQWKARGHTFWVQGKGMILVLLSQLFGATMNVMTQYLEVDRPDGTGMDPFQVRIPYCYCCCCCCC